MRTAGVIELLQWIEALEGAAATAETVTLTLPNRGAWVIADALKALLPREMVDDAEAELSTAAEILHGEVTRFVLALADLELLLEAWGRAPATADEIREIHEKAAERVKRSRIRISDELKRQIRGHEP